MRRGCGYGGIGRRNRLKICWDFAPVPVRFRLSAPIKIQRIGEIDMRGKKTTKLEDAIIWLAHIYARATIDSLENTALHQDVYEDICEKKGKEFTEKAQKDKTFAENLLKTYSEYLKLPKKERPSFDQQQINRVGHYVPKTNPMNKNFVKD